MNPTAAPLLPAPPPTPGGSLLSPPRRLVGLVVLLVLSCCLLAGARPGQDGVSYKVLVLHSYHQGYEWTDHIDRGMHEELERQLHDRYELFVEYMDTKRYTPDQIYPVLANVYRHKYAKTRFDLILTSDDNALEFLLKYGDDLFPDAKRTFCGVNDYDLADKAHARGITGVLDVKDIRGTLEAALALNPKARNVAVIAGASTTAAVLLAQFREVESRFEEQVRFTVLDNLPVPELERRLRELPRDSVILLLSLFSTRDGALFTLQSSVDFISKASDRPIFILNDNYLGSGVVGGSVINGDMQGELAVKTGIKLLEGESPHDIMPLSADITTPMFDHEAMVRFGINEADLPIGSVVINRPVSTYEEYKGIIWATSLIILAQCLTIIALILNRVRRSRAEEALRVSEEKYRKIFETANEGICVFDNQLKVVTVNLTMARMLGYEKPEELINRPSSVVIHPDEMEDHLARFASRTQGVFSNYTRRLRHRDGSTIWTTISGSPLFDEKRQFAGSFGMITDITDLHLAQEALRQAYEEMEQRVVDRTRQLQETNSRLEVEVHMRKEAEAAHLMAKELAESASRAKSEFLANMSHEIRTPINAVIGMAHLLKRTQLTPGQKDYLKKLTLSAHTLLGVINDILDLSKVEAGMLSLENVHFQFDQVIEQVATLMAPKAAEKQLEFLISVSDQVPAGLVGDPLRLTQILMNLCNNAIKFTEDGEVVLAVEETERSEGQVRLLFSVKDTGIGIKEDQLPALFQPFTQADASTTRKYGGTGLGLSLCSQLSEMMGGAIGVESTFGEGSMFWVEIPFTISREQPKRVLSRVSFRGKRALVIDDNATSTEILTAMLGFMGFSCASASSGYEGIGILRETGPLDAFDLVLLDWRMPGIDGLETARIIKTDKGMPYMPPVIMVSAFANDQLSRAVADLDLHGLLYKPVDPSLLYNMVQSIFSQDPQPETESDSRSQAEDFDFSDVTLLLVEDNEINRQVAQEILADTGARVIEAADGVQAVSMLRHNKPDLVLMDIHMPNMDGY